MSTHPCRRHPVALLAVVVLAAALSQAVPVVAAATPAPETTLQWGACPADIVAPDLTCTSVSVPLDYANPGGARIRIAVSRLASTDPEHRRGVLFTNPGGPGGPGLVTPQDLVTLGLPQSVRDTYDVIGFDARGIGHSAPVTCDLTAAQQVSNIPPWARDAADVTRTAAAAQRFARQCGASATASVLPYVTTANTARDMDRIRAALGESTLSYFGESYGTYLGAVYTTLFPQRSDRIVLDSALSPGGWDVGFQRRIARGFEDRFPDFAAYAAANPRYGLGTTVAQVTRTYFRLAAQLDARPAPGGGTGALFRQITFNNLYYDKDFPTLAAAWSSLLAGKAAPAGTTNAAAAASDENYLAGQMAILCNDGPWPRSVATYQDNVAADRVRFPMFGAATANISPCAFWPVAPAGPRVTIGDRGPSNVLIVQNFRDPITPISGATMLRQAFGDRARMVSADQGGHLAYLAQDNRCLNSATTRFLTAGVFPARDVVCAAEPD